MGAAALKAIVATMLALSATPAMAQDRDYCPERPGLDTPACIVDRGHVSVETGLADWTRDDQPGSRTDTVLIGDTLVRLGVSDTIEARIGWTPFGHQRERSAAGTDTANRAGDISLGIKASLSHPDGEGLSVAVLPFVTVPVGRLPIGAGDWGGGVLLPVTYDINDSLSLEATPEIDAAVDQDGDGRHLAYSGTAGLAYKMSKALTLTGEMQVLRDSEPGDHTTQTLAALSLGWMAADNLQFDVFGAAGLNRDAPDAELYAGVSRRF